MTISLFKIKKWTNMALGKSVYHVNQDEGKCFSKEKIRGYYNNLTDKVGRFGEQGNSIPKITVDTGETIYFSIAIFQYGLGAYDLYLIENDKSMLEKALACADWAVSNQQEDGGWNTFAYENAENPYSSMAQGEGISLLVRAYLATKEKRYYEAMQKAKEFMLKPIEEGGTTKYIGSDVYFYEFAYQPLVLNGMIFSIWGIMDYCKLTQDEQAIAIFNKSLITLEKILPNFDMRYWSKYDNGKRISSPFYHRLHIAQLRVLYELTEIEKYKEYTEKWESYQNKRWNRRRALIKKVIQKLFE